LGRQVTFFMAREDEDKFLSFVKTTGDVDILPLVSPSSEFSGVNTLPEPFSMENWRQFWLFNRSISPRFESEFVQEQGGYVLNGLLSPVVEFSRSYVEGNTMRPGRIWAEFTVVDGETNDLDQKDRNFRNWYETLAKWIRKEFYHTGLMIFAGKGALRFQDQGGILPSGLVPGT
jgi:hypothetical protein